MLKNPSRNSGAGGSAPNTVEDEVKALRALVQFLLKNFKETTTRAEALRALLVSRGIVSADDFQQMLSEAEREFDAALDAAFREGTRVAIDAAQMQTLLEHKGKPQ